MDDGQRCVLDLFPNWTPPDQRGCFAARHECWFPDIQLRPNQRDVLTEVRVGFPSRPEDATARSGPIILSRLRKGDEWSSCVCLETQRRRVEAVLGNALTSVVSNVAIGLGIVGV